jgi:hypothetical protein
MLVQVAQAIKLGRLGIGAVFTGNNNGSQGHAIILNHKHIKPIWQLMQKNIRREFGLSLYQGSYQAKTGYKTKFFDHKL